MVSQRLLRTETASRVPAMEVMLNTALVADLVHKGDFGGVREAMEKSLAEGSQTFEQDIARLIHEGVISRAEGLAHADSPNNLLWRLQNDFEASRAGDLPADLSEDEDQATFTEFTLDVKF